MSSDPAIAVCGLSKAYLRYARPSDRLKQAFVPRFQRAFAPLLRGIGFQTIEKTYFQRFWALREVDLTVERGQTVGIIGRNGSGKSTLLKLVCGTLAPTDGDIKTNGRVAALLELGSGFNPEFTGRENIYLNASILGLTRDEIEARIGDIISFAAIGDFIEQPVKTYSSGMAMRLAFAVIAHVDADILVIDEALAVGDAFFQQKCMRWLRQFSENGTVLFCGHDTGAILSFCDHAIWLDKGKMRHKGSAKDVCEAYAAFIQAEAMGLPEDIVKIRKPRASQISREGSVLSGAPAEAGVSAQSKRPSPPKEDRPVIFDSLAESSSFGSGLAEITKVTLAGSDGEPLHWIEGGEDVLVTFNIAVKDDIDRPIVGFHVKDRLGQAILGDNTYNTYEHSPMTLTAGERVQARFRFRLPYIATGRYTMTVAIASGTIKNHIQHHWLHDALVFDVHSVHSNGVMIAVSMQEMSLNVVDLALTSVGGETHGPFIR